VNVASTESFDNLVIGNWNSETGNKFLFITALESTTNNESSLVRSTFPSAVNVTRFLSVINQSME
jgi:hypothetical protein